MGGNKHIPLSYSAVIPFRLLLKVPTGLRLLKLTKSSWSVTSWLSL